MTRTLRTAVFFTAVASAACSEAVPTAPSAIDPTSPVATAMTTPVPAPVSQTLTGTWTGAGQTFTVTQNGTSATGMIAPTTVTVGNGTTLTGSTMITGTVSDIYVTLQMNDRILVRGNGAAITCTAGHMFTGTLSGNTLTGSLAETMPMTCSGDAPAFTAPRIDGPVVYTRH